MCLFFVFGILRVLVFWGYCCFMLSVPVQLIAWKDRPRNDLLCVERDFKHLLTHSVMFTVVAEVKKNFYRIYSYSLYYVPSVL